jgi:hypothetical protein
VTKSITKGGTEDETFIEIRNIKEVIPMIRYKKQFNERWEEHVSYCRENGERIGTKKEYYDWCLAEGLLTKKEVNN